MNVNFDIKKYIKRLFLIYIIYIFITSIKSINGEICYAYEQSHQHHNQDAKYHGKIQLHKLIM